MFIAKCEVPLPTHESEAEGEGGQTRTTATTPAPVCLLVLGPYCKPSRITLTHPTKGRYPLSKKKVITDVQWLIFAFHVSRTCFTLHSSQITIHIHVLFTLLTRFLALRLRHLLSSFYYREISEQFWRIKQRKHTLPYEGAQDSLEEGETLPCLLPSLPLPDSACKKAIDLEKFPCNRSPSFLPSFLPFLSPAAQQLQNASIILALTLRRLVGW